MANTVTFDLVSPERRLASLEATAVGIPGADGDMTAMADHAPTITSLRPGIVTVTTDGGSEEFIVSGGFAEISAGTVSVLAERAVPRAEMTQEMFREFVEEARAKYKKAEEAADNLEGPADEAAKLLSDMVAMGGHIGLTEE